MQAHEPYTKGDAICDAITILALLVILGSLIVFAAGCGPEPVGHVTRAVDMTVTAYCPCEKCCGKWALSPGPRLTANGGDAWARGCAADWSCYSPGTVLCIPGYGIVRVDDRGGDIRGPERLDVRFRTHWEAVAWGAKRLTVLVVDN
jgi:3D (Asp-Asp-Asp) domain-containing protein